MKQILVFLFLINIVFAQNIKRVLFIGNSYTYVNNLPQLLANVAHSTGDSVIFDSSTPGGYTLQGHSTNTTTLSKIMQGGWNYVVLQEQSQLPSFPIQQVEVEVFPYASYLDSVINMYNPCGETMFYMTWGRKNGDASNCATWQYVCTYQGMDSLLRLRYEMMGDSNHAVVSPVGAVWRYIRQNYPAIELYQADESHPSTAGSYAAACCFYTAIFRKNPANITFDFGLSAQDAANIRNAAKVIVYDSLINWHVGEYDLSGDFSYQNINNTTYQFTSQTQNAVGQLWDFGGVIDTNANPIYSFVANGIYPVTLYVYDGCDTISTTQTITISGVGIENHQASVLKVSPNPANQEVIVEIGEELLNKKYEIIEIEGGRMIQNGNFSQLSNRIFINHLRVCLKIN